MRLLVPVVLTWLLTAGCGPKRIKAEAVPDPDRIKAFILAGQGDRYFREGNDHLALMKYTEASVLHPFHHTIFAKLSLAYMRLGRFSEAGRSADRSVGLKPDYAYGHNILGMVQMADLDYKKAIRSFERAIRLLPEPPYSDAESQWAVSFYLNMGAAQMQAGRFDDGSEAIRQALVLRTQTPDEPEIRIQFPTPRSTDPEIQFAYSKLYAGLGQKDLALHYLDKALAFGFKKTDKLLDGEDFQALRDDVDFISLLARYGIEVS